MQRTATDRVGLYFGLMQLLFNLSWVFYVIFLPQLAAEAGISAGAVRWILVTDQVIFLLCDWATGLASDRAAGIVGRLGKLVAGVTAVFALVFLLLPLVAGAGPGVFLVLTATWAVTSSALWAPPLTLLGRYTPPDRQPRVPHCSCSASVPPARLRRFSGTGSPATIPAIPAGTSVQSENPDRWCGPMTACSNSPAPCRVLPSVSVQTARPTWSITLKGPARGPRGPSCRRRRAPCSTARRYGWRYRR